MSKNNLLSYYSEALMHVCKLNTPQARVGSYDIHFDYNHTEFTKNITNVRTKYHFENVVLPDALLLLFFF